MASSKTKSVRSGYRRNPLVAVIAPNPGTRQWWTIVKIQSPSGAVYSKQIGPWFARPSVAEVRKTALDWSNEPGSRVLSIGPWTERASNPASDWGPGRDYQSSGPIKTVAQLHKVARELLAKVHPSSKMAAAAQSALRSPDFFMARPAMQEEILDMHRRYTAPPERRKQPHERGLTIPERHQLKVARDSLRMPDAMLRVMGGPSKAEAREIIKQLTGKAPRENPGSRAQRGRKRASGVARPRPTRRNPATRTEGPGQNLRNAISILKYAPLDDSGATILDREAYSDVMGRLTVALSQVESGHLGNPGGRLLGVAHELRYRHTTEGNRKHPFETTAKVYCMPDGTVQIRSTQGLRLWEEH